MRAIKVLSVRVLQARLDVLVRANEGIGAAGIRVVLIATTRQLCGQELTSTALMAIQR